MKVRPAKKTDKEGVLRFCINTFEWGDYIGQVWDLWYSDRTGILLVAEEDEEYSDHNNKHSSVIAVSHASLCPNKKNVWLEGIRVNPYYRRRSVATQLINKMISYGKEQGAQEACAMVASDNIASQLMMERSGFLLISKWCYYSIDKIPKRAKAKAKVRAKVATLEDLERIRNYLRQSEIYKSSGERYVNSWRWYSLDLDLYSNTLTGLIKNEKVLVIGGDPLGGVAIINKDTHWDSNNDNTLQIVYLDTSNVLLLRDLIMSAINLRHSKWTKYDRVQVYSPQTPYILTVMKQLGIEGSEQFLLYKREI